MTNAITDTLLNFLIETTGDSGLRSTTDLLATGLLDSLTMMDLVVFIETEFQQRIAVEDMRPEMFQTVGSVAQLIDRTAKAQSRAA